MEVLKNNRPFNNKAREECYAKELRKVLGVTDFRREDCSIQIKNITHAEPTVSHLDLKNCSRPGHTKTSSLDLTWNDLEDEIWSVKILTNSRDNAGSLFDKVYDFVPIQTRIQRQLELLDHRHKEIIFEQRNNGGHEYPDGLCAKKWTHLVLKPASPWSDDNIGNGIMQKRIEFPAGPAPE